MIRRSRPRPVSVKRRREAAVRRKVVAEAFARDGGCMAQFVLPEVGCRLPFDAHEIVSRARRPGGHLDVDNVVTVCRAHHDYIDAHPAEAERLGLLAASWAETR